MKRYFVLTLFIIGLILIFVSIPRAANVRFGGVFYNNGVLTTPDSMHVRIKSYPSATDTVYRCDPTAAVWDSAVDYTNGDNYAFITYSVFYGAESTLMNESQKFLIDSLYIGTDTWAKLRNQVWVQSAVRTLTGFTGQPLVDVWSYGSRALTDKTGFTLTTADKSSLASIIQDTLEQQGAMLWMLAYYWGAVNSGTSVYYPNDGTSPKDSVIIYNGSGVAKLAIKYRHSNSINVLDSITVEIR